MLARHFRFSKAGTLVKQGGKTIRHLDRMDRIVWWIDTIQTMQY